MNTNPTLNSIDSTQSALGAVATWMSNEEHIKVIWNNNTECVADLKEKTLSIPRLVESDMIDRENLWIARGHIYHEAGHLAETDLDDRVNNGGLHAVVNALEDRRMEHVMADRYAGCKVAFKKSLAHYSKILSQKFSEGGIPAQYEAICALSFEVEGVSPEWTLSPDADHICNLVRNDFGKVFTCKNTKEIVDLGLVIWDKIKKDEESKDQDNNQSNDENNQSQDGENDQSQDGNGQSQNGENQNEENDSQSEENQSQDGQSNQSKTSGESGDETTGNGQSQSGDEDGDESGQNGQSNESGDEDGNGQSQSGNQSQNGQSSQSGNGQSHDGEDGNDACQNGQSNQSQSEGQNGQSQKSLEAMMAEAEAQCGRDAVEGQAFKKLLDNEAVHNASDIYTSYRAGDVHYTIEADDNTRQSYKTALEGCHGEAAILARTLEEYLRTITRTKMLHCQRRGKIDPRRFAVMAKGLSKEVFKRLSDKHDMDTAVEIVFDESGSMSEYREVRKAIMIIAEALDRVGIPFEITGGTTKGGNFPRGFTRGNPIEYRHYKTFDQNWTRVRSSIERSDAFRNFIDGEMVEFAAARLVERPEKRKIIFSLSDGCPCGGEDNDYELGKKLIRVCNECRNHGIEVYSFGVDTDEPCKYYGREYFVKLSAMEIGKGLSSGITSVMTKGRVA